MTDQNTARETSGEAELVSVAWQRRSRRRGTQQWDAWLENNGELHDHLEYETRALVTREQAAETIKQLRAERDKWKKSYQNEQVLSKSYREYAAEKANQYIDAEARTSSLKEDRDYWKQMLIKQRGLTEEAEKERDAALENEKAFVDVQKETARAYNANRRAEAAEKRIAELEDDLQRAMEALDKVRKLAELMMHGGVSYLNAILETIRALKGKP